MYNNDVESQFQQLQAQMADTENKLSQLVNELRGNNSPDVRDVEYSLREITLSIQNERNQVGALLNALHQQMSSYVQNNQNNQPQQNNNSRVPGFGGGQCQGGGFLQTMEHAVEYGAGFGIGDDLINKLF